MSTQPLTAAQVEQFQRDGYLFCKDLFDSEEMNLLLTTARHDHTMLSHNIPVKDAKGRESKLSLWNHPGDDIYGMFARCHRVVDGMEQLLGGEVYHYHSKMMLKAGAYSLVRFPVGPIDDRSCRQQSGIGVWTNTHSFHTTRSLGSAMT